MVTHLPARELLAGLGRGEYSAEDLTKAFLQEIRAWEPRIGAFLHVDEEAALTQAKSVDARRRRGEPLGALAGLPVAVKDVLCTRGTRTTCGSKLLRDFKPPYDAHVIERLRQADAVLLGKTNMDEFAMGSSTENSAFQPTRNPWDVTRIPGGSSGGSAAAVASGEAPLALGTDTGGSIRQPAALCGVTGLKPTYGRVSRYGLIAFASSLDQVGPLARDVDGVALLFDAIAGHDARDSTSSDLPLTPVRAVLETPLSGLTIGVVKEHFGEGLDAEVAAAVREALKVYEGLGAKLVDVSLPHNQYAVATYYLIATAEASSNLARFDGTLYGARAEQFDNLMQMMERTRGAGFGAEVKRRIMLGTFVLSSGYVEAYYQKALRVRRLIKEDFDRAFASCDIIAGPTSPTTAFPIGERTDDPLAMYLADIYTIGCNLAGLPGMSLPCGFSRAGLPIGLQLLAAPFQEEKLLRAARMYEREGNWMQRFPSIRA